MNNFLKILQLYAFYIEQKKAKFKGINLRGRINFKYFMQTQLLRFCKDTTKVFSLSVLKITTKSIHFLPGKKKIPILWTVLQANKMQLVSKPYILTSSGKKLGNCKDFFERCE